MIEFKRLETYWLDEDTFCFTFDGGIDEEGDEYSIICEYHVDKDRYIFERLYEYDVADTDFTDEQKEYIKQQMIGYMNT